MVRNKVEFSAIIDHYSDERICLLILSWHQLVIHIPPSLTLHRIMLVLTQFQMQTFLMVHIIPN